VPFDPNRKSAFGWCAREGISKLEIKQSLNYPSAGVHIDPLRSPSGNRKLVNPKNLRSKRWNQFHAAQFFGGTAPKRRPYEDHEGLREPGAAVARNAALSAPLDKTEAAEEAPLFIGPHQLEDQ
jgi:hypothetical protein